MSDLSYPQSNPTNAIVDFCPELLKLVHGGETVGRSGARCQITGLSTVNNLIVLHNLFMEWKPERTLEIGLAFGGSALLFASCHQKLDRLPIQQHTAIDPFQTTGSDQAGILAVERAGLSGFLDFRESFSSVIFPQ